MAAVKGECGGRFKNIKPITPPKDYVEVKKTKVVKKQPKKK